MIEQRVYEELKRQGGWQRRTDILPEWDGNSVSNALTRLKRRGAVEKMGDRITTQWRAVDAEVIDRRKFNGGWRGGSKSRA